jgi:hypothetical protein
MALIVADLRIELVEKIRPLVPRIKAARTGAAREHRTDLVEADARVTKWLTPQRDALFVSSSVRSMRGSFITGWHTPAVGEANQSVIVYQRILESDAGSPSRTTGSEAELLESSGVTLLDRNSSEGRRRARSFAKRSPQVNARSAVPASMTRQAGHS